MSVSRFTCDLSQSNFPKSEVCQKKPKPKNSIARPGRGTCLDDAIADSVLEVLDAAAGTAVEDEEDGLVVLGTGLLLDVLLVLLEKLRTKLHVTRLVDSV